MKQIVSVNYKKNDANAFDSRKYNYYCTLPVEVGDLVIAPTAKGDRIACVCEVNIPIEQIEVKVLPLLKEITAYADMEGEASNDNDDPMEKDMPGNTEVYNTTALIEVKQLPIIEDQLRKVKESIEARVQVALSLACTEETYKEVKKARAELNKERTALEERRMEVKRAILAPYERFEALYKECAGDIYASADRKLKERIAEVEDGLRQEKNDNIEAYFLEYAKSKAIPTDLISLEKSGIKVGMSESKKSLQKQVATYIDRIADELALIETQEHKEEIFVEYQKNLNIARAISSVSARHLAVETERRRREEREAEIAQRNAAREKTEAIAAEITAQEPETVSPPTASPDPDVDAGTAAQEGEQKEKRYAASFRVVGSRQQLIELKQYMNERGLHYESISQ